MSLKTWTLIDVANDVYLDDLSIDLADIAPVFKDCKVQKRTLRGGLCDGVDVLQVDNGVLTFATLLTRGMGLWRMEVGGETIGWKSPVRGPVHPKFVPLTEPSGLGWLDGFDELLVRCGLESNGAPEFNDSGQLIYPLHGRIANKPAHKVTVSADSESGEITVTGVVEETRFHFLKLRLTATYITRPGDESLRVQDCVENFSGSDAEMQMLYHINFGEPLLDAGARFVAPVKAVAPRNEHAAAGIATWNEYAAAKPGYSEEVYFMELLGDEDGGTRALLKNAQGDRGVSVRCNTQQLPCFTLWKNTISSPDGYVTGLEPGTNFPNPRSFEGQQKRTVSLASGQSAQFDLTLEIHQRAEQVAKAEADVVSLQGSATPEIADQPRSDWSAG